MKVTIDVPHEVARTLLAEEWHTIAPEKANSAGSHVATLVALALPRPPKRGDTVRVSDHAGVLLEAGRVVDTPGEWVLVTSPELGRVLAFHRDCTFEVLP